MLSLYLKRIEKACTTSELRRVLHDAMLSCGLTDGDFCVIQYAVADRAKTFEK